MRALKKTKSFCCGDGEKKRELNVNKQKKQKTWHSSAMKSVLEAKIGTKRI